MAAVACDAWDELPLPDGSAAVVLSVFAPRGAAEIRRDARAGRASSWRSRRRSATWPSCASRSGSSTSIPGKADRLADDLGLRERGRASAIEAELTLTAHEALLAARMGPAGHHERTDAPLPDDDRPRRSPSS